MSYDVEIKIFGKASDPEAVWELAKAAACEGKVDWIGAVPVDGFADLIEKTARAGQPLSLGKHDTTDFFEEVRSCCQEASLSYVVKFGAKGMEGFSEGISWRPGMKDEFSFHLDGKDPVLRVADVRRAAKIGIAAVAALVEAVSGHAVTGAIETEPGFAEAYRVCAGIPAP